MLSDAQADQLIALARYLDETVAIENDDALAAYLDQPGTVKCLHRIGHRWPVHTQHFREQVLRDRQRVLIVTVAHHQQPSGEPLVDAMGSIARGGDQHLLQERMHMRKHQGSERRQLFHGPCEGNARNARCGAGSCTRNRADHILAPKTAWKPVVPSRPMVAVSTTLPSG